MRRVLKLFILTLLVVISLSGVLAGGMAAWLHNKGGLQVVLSAYLQERFPAVSVTFDDIDWKIDTKRKALVITGNMVRLKANNQSIDVPSIDLAFTTASVIKQMPTAVMIDVDALSVTHTKTGWQVEKFPYTQPDSASALETLSPNILSQIGAFWPDGLMELRVRAKKLEITGDNENWQDMRFQNMNLIAAPEGGVFANGNVSLSLRLSQVVDAGELIPQLRFSARANLFSKLVDFMLETQHFRTAALASHLAPYTGKLPIQPGRVSARLSGSFDEGGLQILSGSAVATDGRLEFGLFSEFGDAFKTLETEFDYSAADNILKISEASLALADGKSFVLSAVVNGVNSDTAMLSGQVVADDIAVRELLDKWPEGQASELHKFISQNSSGGRLRTIALQVKGGLNWAQQRVDISSLGLSGEVTNLRLSYEDAQYQTVVGTLGGQFEMELGAGGNIQTAMGSLSLRDGFARLSGFDQTVKIPRLDAVWRHQPSETLLQNLFVDFGHYGQLLASGRRIGTKDKPVAEIELSLPEMDFQLARHLWPAGFAQKVTGWMARHLDHGHITDGQLDIHLATEGEKFRAVSLDGSLPFQKLSYQMHEGLAPVKQLSGQIDFKDNRLVGTFDAGQANSLVVEQAQISYGPLLGHKGIRDLQFKTLAAGDVTDILTMLDHPKINQIDRFGLRPLTLAGKSRFTLTLTGEAPHEGRMKIGNIGVEATLSDADIDGLPLDQHLQDGTLVISVAGGQTQISGSGRLSGVDSDFNYRRLADKNIELQLRLANSEKLPEWLSQRVGWPLSGAAAALMNITGRAGSKDVKVNLRSDVTDLGVQHDTFEWAKLQGESGFINAQLVFEDGKLTTIEAIDIETGSLRAKGRLAMDDKGIPSFGLLEDLVFPGTELSSVLFERSSDASLSFTAEGKTLNLQPLRRDDKIKQGLEINFDVTADRIVIGPTLSFSGALKGNARPDGNGAANLQGALYVHSNALISEASLQTRFGPDGEYLTGVGLIGGAEADLSYTPNQEGGARLVIQSEKAGRVLAGLSVTDAVRQGRLHMQTDFATADFKRYTTTFNVDDFVVIEAPTAVRMFSVLSLAGLYGLVEGEGTAFARGHAIIHSNGDIHNLELVQASGSALGISLLGTVDKKQRVLDVSGNLIPAKLISNIIGSVPLVAEILTGIDRTGLFVTQFSMQGSIDDPEVDVNALALVPGLLRDIFSPNWLGEERDRIFGVEGAN
ncbi:MAG: AsmA-like C-terminal domain-containing protein [Candidatus Puniceispirillaceae bacterium]